VGQVKRRLDLAGKQFDGLADLQPYSDQQLAAADRRRTCPATGRSVEASWLAEQRLLQPLPILPDVFDIAVTRPVHQDCRVSFEGRSYSVPFRLCGQRLEVRGCCELVQVLHDGQVVAEHPRGTERRLLIDPAHYEGEVTDRVAVPLPPQLDRHHDQQEREGLARHFRRRRGDDDGDPGPAAAQERGAEHPRPQLPVAGPGAAPEVKAASTAEIENRGNLATPCGTPGGLSSSPTRKGTCPLTS